MMIYEPAEDSELIAQAVRRYARGRVLDMGSASGYLSLIAAKKKSVISVLGVDIDVSAIESARRCIANKKIAFKQSDLFSSVRGLFDTIIFNPPYLPDDTKHHDIALHGGKHGYEVIVSFLNQVGDYLSIKGKIILLFSTLSGMQKIHEYIEQNLLDYSLFASQHLFFEELCVYVIQKKKVRRQLEQRGVVHLKYLDQGNRGVVFTGGYRQKKVAIKIKHPGSDAIDRIKNEAVMLSHLYFTGMCSRLLFRGNNYLCYEFVQGTFLPEFLRTGSASDCFVVINTLLNYCRKLDQLGINKEEMTRPLKHVLISASSDPSQLSPSPQWAIKMIDFERARHAYKPHNITQFVQYLTNPLTLECLKGKIVIDPFIRQAAREYKRNSNNTTFHQITHCLRQQQP